MTAISRSAAALTKRAGDFLRQQLTREVEETGMALHRAPDYVIDDDGRYGSDDDGRPDWVKQDMARADAAAREQLRHG